MVSLNSEMMKQRTRLHHQHKDWERNHRDDNTKIRKIKAARTIASTVSCYIVEQNTRQMKNQGKGDIKRRYVLFTGIIGGLIGLLGFKAFFTHDPFDLLYFSFFSFFFFLKDINTKWKYLGILGIIGLIIAILGILRIIEV